MIADRLFLYADDVVLFSAAEQKDLVLTRGILELFAADVGLHTNLENASLPRSIVTWKQLPLCYGIFLQNYPHYQSSTWAYRYLVDS